MHPDQAKESVQLYFSGPFTFTPGERSLFHSAFSNKPCIYLWTFRSNKDQRYHIHYVGETFAFAQRQREHLIGILGLNYGTFDPAAARRGTQARVWKGLWRDKTADGPAKALEQYARGTAAVLDYVAGLCVFVAPLDGPREMRRHVEGSIGWNLRNNHQDVCTLYPADNHIGTSTTKMSLVLELSADEPIAGLDPTLEI
jgi:hypothetical protein